MQTMEEEKREYKEGKRKVDPTTTLLRKEKGMVGSVKTCSMPYNLVPIGFELVMLI